MDIRNFYCIFAVFKALAGNTLMIHIRKSTKNDINEIMTCYDVARRYMRRNGNFSQWVGGYPSRTLIETDISNGVSYVGTCDHRVVMTFALIPGEDPTYAQIYDGCWLNSGPYATIHRLASNGTVGGMLRECIAFCRGRHANLRLDTHADNIKMQRGVEVLGFVRCGVILCQDGTPRIAYQYAR